MPFWRLERIFFCTLTERANYRLSPFGGLSSYENAVNGVAPLAFDVTTP